MVFGPLVMALYCRYHFVRQPGQNVLLAEFLAGTADII